VDPLTAPVVKQIIRRAMPFRSPHPDVRIPELTLTELVLRGADHHAERPAFVDGLSGRSVSFGELRAQIRGLAAGLSLRVGKGDVVAIWAPNVPEYAVVFHAVVRLGAILTTISPAYTTPEVAFQLRDANVTLLVTTAAMVERAREAVRGAASPVEIITVDDADGLPSLASIAVDAEPPAVQIDPAIDIAVMPYSSGTTGLPKGVMLTHRNLVANLVQLDAIESGDLSALVGVLPFFHIYGMTVILNFGMLRGATVVTLPRFELDAFLRVLQDWRIPIAHVAPPIALALAKHPAVDRYDLSSLRCVFCAAAPLGNEVTETLERRLALGVRQGYGMTEASPATHYCTPGLVRRGKVGPLVPNTECRIVDPLTRIDADPGVPGEVWVRGPQVMKGYLNNREATAATVDDDGWLHTGDIGIVDEDGFLEVTDRLKELIKVKGYQVAPAELEGLLLKHPKVSDAAVIGIPDDDAGERPKAFIVASAPVSEEEVREFVDANVAHYKRLGQIAFVESIPKSASGKILRRVLAERERASGGIPAHPSAQPATSA
jgi:acyl-CoA synthetase (AMP-forming)/AMP-acid ligase II